MAHKLAEPYSGKNPVPQIATKLTALVNPERATEAKAAQLQDQSGHQDQKQTEKRAQRLAKGYIMHVTDPVTGDELDIKNADEEPDLRSKGKNVLGTDLPPIDWNEYQRHVVSVLTQSIVYIVIAYTLSFFLWFCISSLFLRSCLILIPTFFAYILFFRVHSISQKDFDDRAWNSERTRGLRAGSDLDGDGKVSNEERVKESAEWANAVMRGLWPTLNPDLFDSLVDMLEDIMQASVPHFVHSVRVSDVDLGSNAARITAIRSLPDSQAQKQHRKAEEKETEASQKSQNGNRVQSDDSGQEGQEQMPDEGQELDEQHVNLELSFAYRGLPSGQSAASKAKNVHLMVEFFLGLRGWWGFKVPVWVEITGAVGTARARLQLISDPPFVKTTMVTLLGLPRITISVTPLSKLLPNVMDLPFISGFVSSAINTALAEYVAPRSLTLDMQRLISGDDVKKDTDAIGVLVVHIHRAMGVKRMDASGGSDPYVTLTYSRLGKPLYSTRIIKGDCNPIFEETAVVLIDANTIRLREKLSFQLWDSDRMTVDDLLGVVDCDIVDLIRNPAQPHRRTAHLTHPHTQHVPGTLEYTVGYYGKRAPTSSLRSSGNDPGIPADLQNNPEFATARGAAMNDLEAAVLVTPPDPGWPSGILSVQVHEIRGLGVKKEGRDVNLLRSVKRGGREGEKGQDDGSCEVEEAEGLPSSYCTISLNDELVYRTRVKPITSYPIFNAGTESFVRDWRTAHVAVAVKDSRMRENDAILGIVMLKLSELLVNASQITRLYSLEEGLGYGRIRISLLFRPVEAKLPLGLLGFDTGTLEVHELALQTSSDSAVNVEDLSFEKCEVRMKTTKSGLHSGEKLSRKAAQRQEDGTITWNVETEGDGDGTRTLPVRQRYSSALLLSFRPSSAALPLQTGLKRSGRRALAVLWLRDLTDNDPQIVELPLWHVVDGDYSRLKLNYVSPDGNLDTWDEDKKKVRRVGSVRVKVCLRPGIGEGHRDMLDEGKAGRKEAWETYTREREGGLRQAVGQVENGSDDDAPGHRKREPSSQSAGDGDLKSRGSDFGSTGNDTHLGGSKEDVDRSLQGGPEESSNTLVSPQKVEHMSPEQEAMHEDDAGNRYVTDDTRSDSDAGSDTDNDTSGENKHKKRGLVRKLKDWRDHEKALHREHRGVMQAKPMRTVEWIKDNVEDGLHDTVGRFSMKTRKPDVETEV